MSIPDTFSLYIGEEIIASSPLVIQTWFPFQICNQVFVSGNLFQVSLAWVEILLEHVINTLLGSFYGLYLTF